MIKAMYKRQVCGVLCVVCYDMMSTKIEKKFNCFRGGTCLDRVYGFYLVVSLASMQIKSF